MSEAMEMTKHRQPPVTESSHGCGDLREAVHEYAGRPLDFSDVAGKRPGVASMAGENQTLRRYSRFSPA